jgi:hypothetical protein
MNLLFIFQYLFYRFQNFTVYRIYFNIILCLETILTNEIYHYIIHFPIWIRATFIFWHSYAIIFPIFNCTINILLITIFISFHFIIYDHIDTHVHGLIFNLWYTPSTECITIVLYWKWIWPKVMRSPSKIIAFFNKYHIGYEFTTYYAATQISLLKISVL